MKLRNLFLASVACAGLFTACSNGIDEVVDGGSNNGNNEGQAYASFAIQFPSATGTRAAGTEDGTAAEQKVNDVTFLFFDAASKSLADIKVIPVAELANTTGSPVYKTKAFVVTKGDRLIYAFVNAQPKVKALATKDGGNAYRAIIEGVGTETAESMSGAAGFTMSNAEVVNTTNVTHLTAALAEAAPVAMKVERTVAKIQYVGLQNVFEIMNANSTVVGKVTLTNIDVVNMNDKYYYLRRAGANETTAVIGGAENDGVNYVIDPNFEGTDPIGTTWGKESKEFKPVQEGIVFYCLENTMERNSQYNGVTTGAMFKARYKMNESGVIENIYRYSGVLYNKVEDVKIAAGITEETTGWDITAWAAKNVDFYKDGICYYPYWIKHVDNGDPTSMGIMEFGVVRNNVYKLNVTSIKGIGAPTDEIDPENPDETASAYIAVSVEVKKWTIRSNENIEL